MVGSLQRWSAFLSVVAAFLAVFVACDANRQTASIARAQQELQRRQLDLQEQQGTLQHELASVGEAREMLSTTFAESARFAVFLEIGEAIQIGRETYLRVTMRVVNNGARPANLTRLSLTRRPVDAEFLAGRRQHGSWLGASDVWSEPSTEDQVLLIVGREPGRFGSWSSAPFAFAAGDIVEHDLLVGPRISDVEYLLADLEVDSVPLDLAATVQPYGIVAVRLVTPDAWELP